MGASEQHQAICVLLPYRNAESTLERAAQSVIYQTVPPRRVLLINDGSEDESNAVAKSIARRHSVVNVIESNGSGIADALNAGLADSSEPLIARMDADDTADSTRFAAQLSLMGRNSLDVCGTQVRRRVDALDPRPVLRYPTRTLNSEAPFWTVRTPVAHPSVLFRRTAIDLVGDYNSMMMRAQDYELWLRMQTYGLRMGNTRRPYMTVSSDSQGQPLIRMLTLAYSAWALEGVVNRKVVALSVVSDLEVLRGTLFRLCGLHDTHLQRRQLGQRLPAESQILLGLAWLLRLSSRECRKIQVPTCFAQTIADLRKQYACAEARHFLQLLRHTAIAAR